MDYDRRYFDLETRVREPLDNPSAKVSPMSPYIVLNVSGPDLRFYGSAAYRFWIGAALALVAASKCERRLG